MEFNVEKIISSVSKINLKGGIFAKACVVVMFVSLLLAIVACVAGVEYISILATVLIFMLAFTVLWRLINFAQKNPQAAILEGAEFLLHEKINLAAKGVKDIPDGSLLLHEEDIKLIQSKNNTTDDELDKGENQNDEEEK